MSKTKGTRYVAQKLVKYFEGKYPKYKDALPRAREIVKDIKAKGEKVTLKEIFARERKKRAGKGTMPYVNAKLFEEHYYFDLINFPAYIMSCSNEVWFVSPLFKKGEEVQGGSYPDYDTYFAPFVNHCNILAKGYEEAQKAYDTQWNVTCPTPVYNKAKKRWEVKIIAIDDQGTEYDYGFNPNVPDSTVVSPQQTTSKPISAPAPSTEGQMSAETEKRLEIEKMKQENIANALKLFASGDITKQEFKELMSMIKS